VFANSSADEVWAAIEAKRSGGVKDVETAC
jgi:hypothetical protein